MVGMSVFNVLSLVLCGVSGAVPSRENAVHDKGIDEHGRSDTIQYLTERVREQDNEISQLKTTISVVMSKLESLSRISHEADRQKRFVVDSEMPVAFHAVNNANELVHLGVNQPITFPQVLLNSGSAFHVNHGMFQAPIAGLYVFSSSVASGFHDNKDEFDAAIVKNGNVLANILGHGDSALSRSDQGSVTVTVQLAANDEVWVKLVWPTDTTLRGGRFTSFTGFLLTSL